MNSRQDALSKALVIGESLIDVITHPDGHVDRRIGGSPANVARGLGRLGVPTDLLTAVSHDDDGAWIQADLEAEGVGILPESWSLRQTPTAVATLESDGTASYTFNLVWDIPFLESPVIPDVVHVGSIGAFRDPGAQHVAALSSRYRDAGSMITFDPNIRPQLLPDRREALERSEYLTQLATVVKLSDEDASWLYPDAELDAVLDRLLGLGASLVAITLGARGSILASRDARVHVPAASTPVIDTIGAGDAYMSTLIVLAYSHTAHAPEAFQLRLIGQRCAASAGMTIGRLGADPPTRSELGLD